MGKRKKKTLLPADFSDLAGKGGGVSIEDTADRAISLSQLLKIQEHARLSLKNGPWTVARFIDGKMDSTPEEELYMIGAI